MAPASAAPWSVKWPRYTWYPASGMMISDGSGMQALSIAMSRTTPP
jgi:hypothetical protein